MTALVHCPQKRGVCKRVYTDSPKKPNSTKLVNKSGIKIILNDSNCSNGEKIIKFLNNRLTEIMKYFEKLNSK